MTNSESFHDIVVRRRSIRRYTDEPIDAEHVKLILQAALMSPNSKSKRSWQFVAVDDKATLQKLADLKPQYATSIPGATLAIVVGADPTLSEAWVEDASVAASFMMLQAEALGIGSCWVQVRGRFTADGTPSEEHVQQVLGMPDTIPVVCVMTFGYKNEVRKPNNIDKLLWERVHIGTWNPSQE